VAVRGDRYILRRPSPGETLGGGVVLDAQPLRRHKRFDEVVLARLVTLRQGDPADVLLQASLMSGAAPLRELTARSRLTGETAAAALRELLETGRLVPLEPGTPQPGADLLVIARTQWETETARAGSEIEKYHRGYPLRRGLPREELKSRLKYSPRLFTAALRHWLAEGALVERGTLLAHPAFTVQFTAAQQTQVGQLLERFSASPYAPPAVKECLADLGEELYNALLDQNELVPVSSEVVFRRVDYDTLQSGLRAHLERSATLTLAQFRDLFGTSRKYAQAFLEHLDAIGVTQREGDLRKLRKTR